MKKVVIVIVSVSLLFTKVNAQGNKAGNAAAIGAAAVLTGLIVANSIESVKNAFERNMLEWLLQEKKFEGVTEFELKLIQWEATKKEDLNNVSIVGFLFKVKDKEPIILLNACSNGWYSDRGIDFAYVTVYEFNRLKWSKLLKDYLSLSSENSNRQFDLTSIPTINIDKEPVNSSIEELSAVSGDAFYFRSDIRNSSDERQFLFKKLNNSNTHLVKDHSEEFIIDLNDRDMNLFLKKTSDVVKIKRSFIFDVTKLLLN